MTTKQVDKQGAFAKAAKVGQRRGAPPSDPGRKELRLFQKTFGKTEGAELFMAGAAFDAECKKRHLRVGAFGKAVVIR